MMPVFPDKAHPPGDADVRRVLGTASALWTECFERLEAAHGPLRFEWKHYGKTAGWTMKVFRGARNLMFVSLREGAFVVSFVMGDRAVAAVGESALPPALIADLVGARRYAEGRGVRVEVGTPADVEHVAALTAIKRAN